MISENQRETFKLNRKYKVCKQLRKKIQKTIGIKLKEGFIG